MSVRGMNTEARDVGFSVAGGDGKLGPVTLVRVSGSSFGRGVPSGAGLGSSTIRPIVAAGGGLAQPGAGRASTTCPFADRLLHSGTAAAQLVSPALAIPEASTIANIAIPRVTTGLQFLPLISASIGMRMQTIRSIADRSVSGLGFPEFPSPLRRRSLTYPDCRNRHWGPVLHVE